MFDYLDNLKSKPNHIKNRFAFLTSLGITGLIFVGWISSYGFKDSPVTKKVYDKEDKNKVVAEAPISSLRAAALGAWDDLKGIVLGSNKAEYSADNVEISAGKR